MQSTKESIDYFTNSLEFYGIRVLKAEDIRKAKFNENSKELIEKLKETLLKLCVLFLMDFEINFDIVNIEIKKIDLILFIFLKNYNCPFLESFKLGILNNSRDILLTIGWLLGSISYFEIFRTKSIEKLQGKVDELVIYE
jgi:hypothetical protein